MKRLRGFVCAVALIAGATGAAAQVRYQPYVLQPTAPTPYGYPVPFGYAQPDEVLGTSPSYVFSTNGYGPTVSVVQHCQYPEGWNVTDFSRDVNGIPNGSDHVCPATGRGVRSRY